MTSDTLTYEERRSQAQQLPTPNPLGTSLQEFVVAKDLSAAAAEYGLDFRPDTYRVRVFVRLVPERPVPSGYRMEIRSRGDSHVIATVHVDDLVPLAMEDAVRKIEKPPESRSGRVR